MKTEEKEQKRQFSFQLPISFNFEQQDETGQTLLHNLAKSPSAFPVLLVILQQLPKELLEILLQQEDKNGDNVFQAAIMGQNYDAICELSQRMGQQTLESNLDKIIRQKCSTLLALIQSVNDNKTQAIATLKKIFSLVSTEFMNRKINQVDMGKTMLHHLINNKCSEILLDQMQQISRESLNSALLIDTDYPDCVLSDACYSNNKLFSALLEKCDNDVLKDIFKQCPYLICNVVKEVTEDSVFDLFIEKIGIATIKQALLLPARVNNYIGSMIFWQGKEKNILRLLPLLGGNTLSGILEQVEDYLFYDLFQFGSCAEKYLDMIDPFIFFDVKKKFFRDNFTLTSEALAKKNIKIKEKFNLIDQINQDPALGMRENRDTFLNFISLHLPFTLKLIRNHARWLTALKRALAACAEDDIAAKSQLLAFIGRVYFSENNLADAHSAWNEIQFPQYLHPTDCFLIGSYFRQLQTNESVLKKQYQSTAVKFLLSASDRGGEDARFLLDATSGGSMTSLFHRQSIKLFFDEQTSSALPKAAIDIVTDYLGTDELDLHQPKLRSHGHN